MDRTYSEYLEKLRSAGLRPTRQRLALSRLLFEGAEPRHVTAEGLHGQATAAGAGISLATVYNTLRQFTSAGLLREIVVDPDRTYFDTNVENHHHFYFVEEKRLADIADGDLEITGLPKPPDGSEISQIDVIVRLK